MYNDRRYSLARYSVNQETKTVEIAESFSEAMGAVAGAAIPVDFRDKYTEALQGSARGTVSVISTFSAADRLFTTARMSADVVTRAVLSEAIQGSIYGQKNTPAALTVRDVLAALAYDKKEPVEQDLSGARPPESPAEPETPGACGPSHRGGGGLEECHGLPQGLRGPDLHVRGDLTDHGADNPPAHDPARGRIAD